MIDTGRRSSADAFGTRAFLKNNYLYRMSGAVLGIYGNSKEEAIYPVYFVDQAEQALTGANRYTLRFPPGQLPPVHAFWSLTLYELPASLLYANPLDRYLINSPMLSGLTRDADGGITLYVQNESPGKERGIQLAAGAERVVLHGIAPVLAGGCSAQRPMDGAAAATRELNSITKERQP